MTRTTLAATLCFAILHSTPPAPAAQIDVTSTAPGLGGPGCTLRDAITAAEGDVASGGCATGSGADTLVLQPGATYSLDAIDNQEGGPNGLPVIASDVSIEGNDAIIERSTSSTNAFRLFRVAAGGALRLDTVTLQFGSAAPGGAINSDGTVHITNCLLRFHRAIGDGGTVAGVPGTFNGLGGAIYSRGDLRIEGSTLSGNLAHGGSGASLVFAGTGGGGGGLGAGGAIYNDGGTVRVTATTLSGNTVRGGFGNLGGRSGSAGVAGGGGGGAGGAGGAPGTPGGNGDPGLFGGGGGGGASSVNGDGGNGGDGGFGAGGGGGGGAGLPGFSGGAGGGSGFGAGIGGFGGAPPLGSVGGGGGGAGGGGAFGGAVASFGGSVKMENSTLSGNATVGGIGGQTDGTSSGRGGDGGDGLGGALFLTDGADVLLVSSTVAGNTVMPGIPGGVYGGGVTGGGNLGEALGNAVFTHDATLTIGNTLLADNTVIFSANVSGDVDGEVVSLGYNLIEDASGASVSGSSTGNLLGVDGGLAGLKNNGGPTETQALNPGSAAIDAGRPQSAGGCTDADGAPLTQDQRSGPRPFDGGVGGTRCDIGAFEVGPPGIPKCDGREPTIVGTNGPDLLFGTDGDDVIVGWDGDDVIYGLRGNDVICGGPGNDVLIGASGDDRLFGRQGEDTLRGGEGDDVMYGGPGRDVFLESTGNDRLYGEEGPDVLSAGDGDDQLDGGPDGDTLIGGAGGDLLLGDAGNDFLDAGDGTDVLAGGGDTDICDGAGGSGIDIADFSCETVLGVP